MHYGYLLFKRIQGGYFHKAHFYKANITLILLFLKSLHIYIYYHSSFIENWEKVSLEVRLMIQ